MTIGALPAVSCQEEVITKLEHALHASDEATFITVFDSLDSQLLEAVVTPTVASQEEKTSILAQAIFKKRILAAHHIVDRLWQEKREVSLTSCDMAGWTAVHHAALCDDDSLYKKLKQFDSAKQLKSPYAKSPGMLRKLTLKSKRPFTDENCRIYFQKPGDTSDTLLSGKELIEQFGHLFVKKPEHFTTIDTMTVELLYERWQRCRTKELSDRPAARAYMRHIEKLKANGNIEEQFALRVVPGLGLGLFARTTLAPGTILPYAGRLLPKQMCDPQYTLDYTDKLGTDSGSYRSLGSMVNFSFPNAVFGACKIGNIPTNYVEVIQPIPAGEQVFVSYGSVYFKQNVPRELNPVAMVNFVKNYPLKEYLESGVVKGSTAWNYLLKDAPMQTVFLILSGDLLLDDAELLYQKFVEFGKGKESSQWVANSYDAFTKKVPLRYLRACIECKRNYSDNVRKIADEIKECATLQEAKKCLSEAYYDLFGQPLDLQKESDLHTDSDCFRACFRLILTRLQHLFCS